MRNSFSCGESGRLELGRDFEMDTWSEETPSGNLGDIGVADEVDPEMVDDADDVEISGVFTAMFRPSLVAFEPSTDFSTLKVPGALALAGVAVGLCFARSR
jgi:hypothetical protein